MTIQALYPLTQPSLNLDFANTKKLDPRITFTRASSARFYDGKTVAKAEENLVLYSQQFDNASWAKNEATVTANTVAAPDGTTTADTITESTANTAHRIQSNAISWVSGQSYVISFFAKNGDANYLQFSGGASLGAGVFANFDIATGVTGSSSGVTSSIVDVGGGWYRCIVAVTAATTTAQDFSIGLADSASLARLAAYVGTSRFAYLWGAQVEARSSVTAYTPTTTQPITNYIPVLQTALDNVARFDHNPTTGESLGLFVEEQRTNLLVRSEQFSDATWGNIRSSETANTIIAPDGALTVDKLISDTTAANSHGISQSYTFTNAVHTFSCYAKAAEYGWLRLIIADGTTTFSCFYDLLNGAIGTVSGAIGAIINVGNGWYRCVLTTSTATAAAAGNCQLYMAEANNDVTLDGNGYSGIYIWGAQLEAGAFATSYIPTVASQVTRSADAASMTGANFSSWFNQAEGTFYSEASKPAAASSGLFFSVNDNSASNRLSFVYTTATQLRFRSITAGVNDVAITSNVAASGFLKMAGAYKFNDYASSVSGAAVGTDSIASVPVVSQLNIGSEFASGAPLNGHVRKLAYYSIRNANAQLQALTA